VADEGEEGFVLCGGEPHEPDVGDRELGGGACGGAHGVERVCDVVVFGGDGALPGAVRYALSAIIG